MLYHREDAEDEPEDVKQVRVVIVENRRRSGVSPDPSISVIPYPTMRINDRLLLTQRRLGLEPLF